MCVCVPFSIYNDTTETKKKLAYKEHYESIIKWRPNISGKDTIIFVKKTVRLFRIFVYCQVVMWTDTFRETKKHTPSVVTDLTLIFCAILQFFNIISP